MNLGLRSKSNQRPAPSWKGWGWAAGASPGTGGDGVKDALQDRMGQHQEMMGIDASKQSPEPRWSPLGPGEVRKANLAAPRCAIGCGVKSSEGAGTTCCFPSPKWEQLGLLPVKVVWGRAVGCRAAPRNGSASSVQG